MHHGSRPDLNRAAGVATLRASIWFSVLPRYQQVAGPAVSDEKLPGAGVGFGVRKGDAALKDALNQALRELKAYGTIDRYAAKYFDVKVVLK